MISVGKKTLANLAMAVVIITTTAACSNEVKTESSADTPSAVKRNPVELTFYFVSTNTRTEEELNSIYTQTIQKKYPHISLKFIQNQESTSIDKVVAAGISLDLIFSSFSRLRVVKENGYFGGDLSDLVKKYNFDLSRIEDAYLKQAYDIGDGKLNSLPLYDIRLGLFYNKALFDKFGVPYPKDGMLWEDVYPIARAMTRIDNGVQYLGFGNAASPLVINNQYSMPTIDYKAEKASVNTDKWKQYIEKFIPLYTASSSYKPTVKDTQSYQTLFMKTQTTAMYVQYHTDALATFQAMGDNWDVVTLPEMNDLRGIGSQPYPVHLAIASTTKHRDDAFLALDALLTDEAETSRSEDLAFYPILKNPKVKETFGKNTEHWKGKNIKAITTQRPANAVPYSDYNTNGETALWRAIFDVVPGVKDLNTALRDAEETVNKQIEAEKKK